MTIPQAVIVSTARTPIGKAFRGAVNITHGSFLAGHAIAHAVARAGVEPGAVAGVLLGCGLPEGATGRPSARSGGCVALRRQRSHVRIVPGAPEFSIT